MMQKVNRRKSTRREWKEFALMAVPGLAGAGLFIWGLKAFEWAGHVCPVGGLLVGIGACFLLISLYIYWWTDFRGKPDGGSFFGFFMSTAGTAILVVILTRLVT